MYSAKIHKFQNDFVVPLTRARSEVLCVAMAFIYDDMKLPEIVTAFLT